MADGARQHRAPVRHRATTPISRWMPSRTTAASSSNSSPPTVGSSATCRRREESTVRPTAGSWTTPRSSIWGSPTLDSQLEPALNSQRRLLESNGLYLGSDPPGVRLRHGAPAGQYPLRDRQRPARPFRTAGADWRLQDGPEARPEGHRLPPLDDPYLEAGDADARPPGPGRRARAATEREPAGSQGRAGIHEVRRGDQPRDPHAADRRRTAHPGEHHRRQSLAEQTAPLRPGLRRARGGSRPAGRGRAQPARLFPVARDFSTPRWSSSSSASSTTRPPSITWSTPASATSWWPFDISGNQYFTHGRDSRADVPADGLFLQFPHGRYSESLLRRDRTTIANLYQSNGFRDVKVTSSRIDNYRGKRATSRSSLEIQEGPQYLVNRLERGWHRETGQGAHPGQLSSTDGQPFSEFNVAVDRDTILAQYFENGFPHATFEWSSKPAAEPNRVDLHYTIHEGQQQFVRQVLINPEG